jgi:phosphoesterase RecJ-like protein
MSLNGITIDQAAERLKKADNVVLLMHRSPDGDTTGSAFALFHTLRSLGKKAKVVCSDDFPRVYSYMYGLNEENTENFEPQYVVAVDVADLQLLGDLREQYEGKINLCIDHHVSNTFYADFTLVEVTAAAACEVVYKLAKILTDGKLSDIIIKCLYTGIATDTGCFKFSSTTAQTHIITSELMQMSPNVDYAYLNRILFDIKTPARVKLEAEIINTMDTFADNQCNMALITAEMLAKIAEPDSELDGITALTLQYESVKIGVLIKEAGENEYKVSMRGVGDVNVANICKQFDGGGHKKAAGCRIFKPLCEVKAMLKQAIESELEKCNI